MASKPVFTLETVKILENRLNHGRNVVGILENQVDTAQQNISLLQGQISLCTETISSLKKHFTETERILNNFASRESDDELDKGPTTIENCRESCDKLTAYVYPTMLDSGPKKEEQLKKREHKRHSASSSSSSYAQQLHQIVATLQRKESIKDHMSKEDNLTKQYKYDEFETSITGKSSPKCEEKRCYQQSFHEYLNSEEGSGFRENNLSITKRKDHDSNYIDEEPLQTKYKRVEKVNETNGIARKTFNIFSKRHYYSYNPRYDLDLHFVPPPVPAKDLIKQIKEEYN